MTYKDQFFNYLVALNLFLWNICETNDSFEACISQESNPNLNDFTEVRQNPDGTWYVRLAKLDLFNDSITTGFFKK